MNEENKVAETENENNANTAETKSEESKKGFKAWFNKTKEDVNNYLLESKIENTFNKNNEEFSLGIYNPDSILSSQKQIFGYFDNEGKLVVFGEREIPKFSIILSNKTKEAFTILSKDSACSIEATVDGIKYVRSGTKYNITNQTKEVKIIKVMGRTFVYEGE